MAALSLAFVATCLIRRVLKVTGRAYAPFPIWQQYSLLLPNWQRTSRGSLRMYGQLLRQLRESKARSQADVARSVAISPAHLARLESGQRGLYLEDFIKIAEA